MGNLPRLTVTLGTEASDALDELDAIRLEMQQLGPALFAARVNQTPQLEELEERACGLVERAAHLGMRVAEAWRAVNPREARRGRVATV